MSEFPRIVLHARKSDAVKRFHPWIFSGAIRQISPEITPGDIVDVYSESGEYLATGHYNAGAIAVKVFSFQPVQDLEQLFHQKFQHAYGLRKALGLASNSSTNCYRLINTEGDGLPGLIIDWYNGTAVIQISSLGMYRQQALIVDCLQHLYGQTLDAIFDKSASVLGKSPVAAKNHYIFGNPQYRQVLEHQHHFFVDWETGQKTGFFIDQRENRLRLSHYVSNQRVLNAFCYSGGFSVYALQAGAQDVHSVDSSAKAIEWTQTNVSLNSPCAGLHTAVMGDVFDFLKEASTDYDVIVLDPPAFAKSLSARHQAVMAYRRLNRQALAHIRPGGMLFTFSCSQVVTPEHFRGAVTAAAIDSGRPVCILEQLTQPADHPVSLYHPEGYYLKGLVLRVE